MPRKKINTIQDSVNSESYDMKEFAKNLGYWQSIFSPEIVNQQLKTLGLNPLAADEEKINAAMQNPRDNEDALIGYSQYFDLTDMLYKRTLLYLGNLLSWDLDFVCTNAKATDYTSKSYQKDEAILRDFLDRFDYKEQFTSVVRQLFRQESFYCVLRDEDEKYVLQELPYKKCKITGKFPYGLLFDLDMSYFLQAGVDIRCYPKVIIDKYKDIFKDGQSINNYRPSAKLNSRDGTYAFWTQLSPEDKFFMWKLTPEVIAQIPFFAPQFADLVLRPTIRRLQKNKYIQDATKILVNLIGLNKDNKTGNVRDMLSISPETAAKFISLMKSGLDSTISCVLGPWSDTKVVDFENSANKKSILDEYTKVTVGSGGNNTRLLYNSSDKSNSIESQNSIAIDESLVEFLYPYFSNFIEYYVNRKTKHYKFKIRFSGTRLPAAMEKKKKDAMEMAAIGLVDLSAFAASKGMNPFDLERKMEMHKAKKFNDLFEPLVSANQMSGKDAGGRPQKPTEDLTDNGLETRDVGSNISKGTGEV